MKAFLFPGQGAQYLGMGKHLFNDFPEFIDIANEVLGFSLPELCLADPQKQLNLTQFTQPAIYTVSALSYLKHIKNNPNADFMAGHSLGEYTALFAAGVFSFEEGLRLVAKRGALMSQAPTGAMAAVLGLNTSKIVSCLHENSLQTIDIANLNTKEQIVISGPCHDIANSQAVIEKAGGHFVPLNTSGAFHSRYMHEAQTQFAEHINACSFKAPKIPVIANVTAAPHQYNDLKDSLIAQITSPVNWTKSIHTLLASGCSEFIELGPKTILTKMVDTIKAETQHILPTMGARDDSTRDESARDEDAHDNQCGNLSNKRVVEQGQQQVLLWNKTHPLGTDVHVRHLDSRAKTRSQAQLLFGQRAGVYLEGYSGYFALSDLTPIQPSSTTLSNSIQP